MNSVTVKKQQRIADGLAMLNDFQRSGLKLNIWLERNHISKDRYYYWRRKLRDACLEEIAGPVVNEPTFIEIPETMSVSESLTGEHSYSTAVSPSAKVVVGRCEFQIMETASAEFLRKLAEAFAHV